MSFVPVPNDRPDRHVGDRLAHRASHCSCVCVERPRIATAPITARASAGDRSLLPDVQAGRARQRGDVGAIVDDQRGARRASALNDRVREIEKRRRSPIVLQRSCSQRTPADEERPRDVDGRAARARATTTLAVDDARRRRTGSATLLGGLSEG